MAERKYLDYDGLVQVSGEIKSRVKSVDSLPVSAPAGAAYLYVGEDTENYKKGHTYQYQTNSWVDITPPTSTFNDEDFSVDAQNEVSLLPARRVYRGTRAAWDLLSVAEKTQYGATAFTDDESGGTMVYLPTVSSYYNISASNSYINMPIESGGGVIFLAPFGCDELHFTCNNSVKLQIGNCTVSATLPSVIMSGTERGSYVNVNTVVGENIVSLKNPSGVNGMSARLYIGVLNSTQITQVSNIYFVKK